MRPRRVFSKAGIAPVSGAGGSRRVFSEFGSFRPGHSNSVLCIASGGAAGGWLGIMWRQDARCWRLRRLPRCAPWLWKGPDLSKRRRAPRRPGRPEQLRSAVVEALAHQIKTPLCVIQAASSSLPALGELYETQAEFVASIDQQSTKLNELVTRLLGAADLESAQIKPNLAPVLLSDLLKAAISSVEDQAQRERFQVSIEKARGACPGGWQAHGASSSPNLSIMP